jgi:eukaryotic-like serine/threonine-protein kinase
MKPNLPSMGSIKPIFLAARRITDPNARQAYLDEACGEDPELRKNIDSLLAALDRDSANPLDEAAGQLQPPHASIATLSGDESIDISSHPVIGQYKLLDQLGEGGMGTVYLAEQKTPVKRQVALKLIKPGMDTKEVIARFEAERQALAMMEHSNIARIFDAGMTKEGRPYFVMELVRGFRIDKYCEDAGLSLPDRLQLFIDVCRAIQHAHQKGIIHRDLKPSNIMVTLHDGVPVVKVIDFGIAKALDHELTERTLFTHVSELIGTPVYMSPEQAEMSGLDVDTRSDVYSLGVLLYKLLTGVTPFDRKTLNNASYDEMRRIICEDEPQPPSHRVSTLRAEQNPTRSQARQPGIPLLDRKIKKELDWIVMKSLEKDRTRRYESASALAADIERYLNDKPVEAVPPSTAYQLRKFARRNKSLIMTTGFVVAALVIGTGVSIWQAREAIAARLLADQQFVEADRQRKKAERAAELAQQNEEFSRQLVYAADVRMAAQAWQSGDVSRLTSLLDRHTQNAADRSRRGYEWWYLRQFGSADFRDIATQTGGSCAIRFSPDGKYLVTGQYDGTVCFRNARNNDLLATVHGHEGLVRGVDFAPDGNRMASIGDDGMICLWDLERQKRIFSFQAHPDHGFRVFFVLDGKVLASCGEDTSIRLWNTSTGEALGEVKNGARTVERAAMDRSPDGRLLVSADPDGEAFVIDVNTKKKICKLDLGKHEDIVCSAGLVRFSPNGQLVAVATSPDIIRLCDVPTGNRVDTFIGHEDQIQGLAFHPNGHLVASCDMAGVIRVWSLNTDDETKEVGENNGTAEWPSYFQGHFARAWSLDFSPDGTDLVSVGRDGNVRSWSGRAPAIQHIRETGNEANAAKFTLQGNELFIAGDSNIRIWNRMTQEVHLFGESFSEWAWSVAVSPDGNTWVTGHTEGIIRFWNHETGQLTRTLTAHEGKVRATAFSHNGELLATASRDGTVKLWDTDSGEQVAVFHIPPHCNDVALSPDGRLLACSALDDAMIFDVVSRKRLHLLQGHQNSANRVVFSPDGKVLATASDDRTIRIWNAQTGEEQHVIDAHKDTIDSLAFTPDGHTIASGGDMGMIAFSHVETGRFLFDTKVGEHSVRSLHFSPDGQTLSATVGWKGVVLLHAPSTTPEFDQSAAP